MSVINSMLRDLDRRHAPLPAKTQAQPTLVQTHRAWPRSAFALCALIIVVVWSWSHRSQQTVEKNAHAPAAAIPVTKSLVKTVDTTAINSPLPAGPKGLKEEGERGQRTEISAAATSPSSLLEKESSGQIIGQAKMKSEETITTDKVHEKPALAPAPLPQGEGITAPETKIAIAEKVVSEKKENSQAQSETHNTASIVKRQSKTDDDTNAQRYQLARAALAQNQPQRAYELLRDNPPPLVSATDYHTVLAAVEQQLGHYADASLRYQQLLMLDQNQASWWLGFALSLEGEHRNNDALAAYRHAEISNSLPEAARQYVTARIAALSTTSGQTVEAEH